MYDNSMLNIKHNQTGFTLVELLLAMLIGVLIMGGAMKLFITTRDTQRSSEDAIRLISDARFVMETMAFDLRHAGIWGGMNETKMIACKKSSDLVCPGAEVTELAAVTDDCVLGGLWYIDLDIPVKGFDANNPYVGTCATQGYQPGTDTLELRYADTLPIPSAGPNKIATGVAYVRSNIRNGMLFVGDYPAASLYKWIDVPLDSVTKNYPLRSMFYYVSDYTYVDANGNPKAIVADRIPSLHRVELRQGPKMVDDVLIPGVEDFQLEYGLDTTGDLQVNTYVSAANVIDTTLGTNWQNGRVVAVKIWLLMRTEKNERSDVSGTQTFALAGNDPVNYTDNVRRFLIKGVVRMRNTTRIDLLK